VIGTPETLRNTLRGYEKVGCDEVLLLLPPRAAHEDLVASLTLVGEEVLPEFIEREERARDEKAKRLEPYIEAALARRPPDPEAPADYSFGAVPVSWDGLAKATEIVDIVTGAAKVK